MNVTQYAHLTFADHDDWSLKMDQFWITDILHACGILPTELDDVISNGGVLVFQADPNREHRDALQEILRRMPWCVLIATSDECSLFDWSGDGWEIPNVLYWIQTPKPGKSYPTWARFLPLGCPAGLPGGDRRLSIAERGTFAHFRGQVQHSRRADAVRALRAIQSYSDRSVLCEPTTGFFAGIERSDYLRELEDSVFVICPAGSCTQDTFRAYEALEAGCIPIVDALRHDGGGRAFWSMIGMDWLAAMQHWANLPAFMETLAKGDLGYVASLVRQGWKDQTAETATRLCKDIATVSGRTHT